MLSLFFNAHKLPSIDLVIEHSKYFSVTLKIVRTLESVSLSFSAKAYLPVERELLNLIIYTFLTASFAMSFTKVSSVRAWSNPTALNKTTWGQAICCPGMCGGGVGQRL